MDEKEIRESIAQQFEQEAIRVMRSNEYSFNDTAVRAKALFYAADLVRGNVAYG